MLEPQQQVEFAQRRLYWRRYAASTCAVVAAAVALSAIAWPLSTNVLLGCGLAGGLLFLGEWAADRQHTAAALALVPAAFLLFGWSVVAAGVPVGSPIMWVQAFGTLSVAFLGARAVCEKLSSA